MSLHSSTKTHITIGAINYIDDYDIDEIFMSQLSKDEDNTNSK